MTKAKDKKNLMGFRRLQGNQFLPLKPTRQVEGGQRVSKAREKTEGCRGVPGRNFLGSQKGKGVKHL